MPIRGACTREWLKRCGVAWGGAGCLCRHAAHPGRLTQPKGDGVAGMDLLMRVMHGWSGGGTGWWTR